MNDNARRLSAFNERMVRKHNASGIFREENKFQREKETMTDIANSRRLPSSVRDKAKKILERGDYDKTSVVVDEGKAKRYDEAVGREIREAIASGRLPKPQQKRYGN